MRRNLMILVASLILILTVAAHAQPLVSTSSLTITFTPVVIEEIVEEDYEKDGVVYSPVVRFKQAYRVSTTSETGQ